MGRVDQGVQKGRYQIIPRVLVFAVGEDGRVLLIKGAPHKKVWANRYNGVGGHVERGEDIWSAANREFLEETGLKLTGLRLVGTITVDTGEPVGVLFFVFRGACEAGTPLDSDEGTLEWVAVDDLNDLPLVEDLPLLLDRVLANRADILPFFGQYHYDSDDHLVIHFSPMKNQI